eukprot:gnl/Carplike_NY0171/3795_a5124_280.p1 GENE.gnl/Carplike_NY0171/3795_a5124_280~~gnl/Carplike_NY0171/3795_a5124_280.p1  ORF type:complete len:820 (-),score=224.61 gnl/Carplike_NY0171/3795_a5124_280:50-2302(-)
MAGTPGYSATPSTSFFGSEVVSGMKRRGAPRETQSQLHYDSTSFLGARDTHLSAGRSSSERLHCRIPLSVLGSLSHSLLSLLSLLADPVYQNISSGYDQEIKECIEFNNANSSSLLSSLTTEQARIMSFVDIIQVIHEIILFLSSVEEKVSDSVIYDAWDQIGDDDKKFLLKSKFGDYISEKGVDHLRSLARILVHSLMKNKHEKEKCDLSQFLSNYCPTIFPMSSRQRSEAVDILENACLSALPSSKKKAASSAVSVLSSIPLSALFPLQPLVQLFKRCDCPQMAVQLLVGCLIRSIDDFSDVSSAIMHHSTTLLSSPSSSRRRIPPVPATTGQLTACAKTILDIITQYLHDKSHLREEVLDACVSFTARSLRSQSYSSGYSLSSSSFGEKTSSKGELHWVWLLVLWLIGIDQKDIIVRPPFATCSAVMNVLKALVPTGPTPSSTITSLSSSYPLSSLLSLVNDGVNFMLGGDQHDLEKRFEAEELYMTVCERTPDSDECALSGFDVVEFSAMRSLSSRISVLKTIPIRSLSKELSEMVQERINCALIQRRIIDSLILRMRNIERGTTYYDDSIDVFKIENIGKLVKSLQFEILSQEALTKISAQNYLHSCYLLLYGCGNTIGYRDIVVRRLWENIVREEVNWKENMYLAGRELEAEMDHKGMKGEYHKQQESYVSSSDVKSVCANILAIYSSVGDACMEMNSRQGPVLAPKGVIQSLAKDILSQSRLFGHLNINRIVDDCWVNLVERF